MITSIFMAGAIHIKDVIIDNGPEALALLAHIPEKVGADRVNPISAHQYAQTHESRSRGPLSFDGRKPRWRSTLSNWAQSDSHTKACASGQFVDRRAASARKATPGMIGTMSGTLNSHPRRS